MHRSEPLVVVGLEHTLWVKIEWFRTDIHSKDYCGLTVEGGPWLV